MHPYERTFSVGWCASSARVGFHDEVAADASQWRPRAAEGGTSKGARSSLRSQWHQRPMALAARAARCTVVFLVCLCATGAASAAAATSPSAAEIASGPSLTFEGFFANASVNHTHALFVRNSTDLYKGPRRVPSLPRGASSLHSSSLSFTSSPPSYATHIRRNMEPSR